MAEHWDEVRDLLRGEEDPDVHDLEQAISRALMDETDEKTKQTNDTIRQILETDFDWDVEMNEDMGGFPVGFDPDFKELDKVLATNLPKKKAKFVEIQFCQECNNMLYPKEDKNPDKSLRKLIYYCKDCGYQEDAEDPCVHINTLTQDVDAISQVHSDIATDPTLHHTRGLFGNCPQCNFNDAVFFQTPVNRDKSDMRQFFVCTNESCGHKWQGEMGEN